jgi:hypothetical protein
VNRFCQLIVINWSPPLGSRLLGLKKNTSSIALVY